MAGRVIGTLKKQYGDRVDAQLAKNVAIVAAGDYHRAHPTTALLIIEVADSSLVRDRRKAALYAAAGIPEYWIVDLTARVVEVYSAPGSSGYATQRTAVPDEVLLATSARVRLSLDARALGGPAGRRTRAAR